MTGDQWSAFLKVTDGNPLVRVLSYVKRG